MEHLASERPGIRCQVRPHQQPTPNKGSPSRNLVSHQGNCRAINSTRLSRAALPSSCQAGRTGTPKPPPLRQRNGPPHTPPGECHPRRPGCSGRTSCQERSDCRRSRSRPPLNPTCPRLPPAPRDPAGSRPGSRQPPGHHCGPSCNPGWRGSPPTSARTSRARRTRPVVATNGPAAIDCAAPSFPAWPPAPHRR